MNDYIALGFLACFIVFTIAFACLVAWVINEDEEVNNTGTNRPLLMFLQAYVVKCAAASKQADALDEIASELEDFNHHKADEMRYLKGHR